MEDFKEDQGNCNSGRKYCCQNIKCKIYFSDANTRRKDFVTQVCYCSPSLAALNERELSVRWLWCCDLTSQCYGTQPLTVREPRCGVASTWVGDRNVLAVRSYRGRLSESTRRRVCNCWVVLLLAQM
jgi:hypothetical protein